MKNWPPYCNLNPNLLEEIIENFLTFDKFPSKTSLSNTNQFSIDIAKEHIRGTTTL
jgi:hypothetical protein